MLRNFCAVVMIICGLLSWVAAGRSESRLISKQELAALFGGACQSKSTQSAGCSNNPATVCYEGVHQKIVYSGQDEAVCTTGGANLSCGPCGTPMVCVTTYGNCNMDCLQCDPPTTSSVNTDCTVSGTCTGGG